MKLSRVLLHLRRSRGWSVRTMAREIGIPYPTLSRIERGAQCDLDSAAMIVVWLITKDEAA